MRKTLTIAALIALLAVPFMAVSAGEQPCPDGPDDGGTWIKVDKGASSGGTPDGYPVDGATKYCFKAGINQYPTIEAWRESEQDLSHWAYFIPEGCDLDPGPRELIKTTYGDWSPWSSVGDSKEQRTRVVTLSYWWLDPDGKGPCQGEWEIVKHTQTQTRELFNDCAGWAVIRGNGRELDRGQWTLPFEIESAESNSWLAVISESKGCLQTPGEPTPTLEPEPTATPTPPPGDCNTEGDGICPGDDDDPEEHPSTGGEIDAGLAVVTALSGLALTGIGGSILFMKRRASR